MSPALYGETKELCKKVGKTLDQISDMIIDEKITV